MAESLWSIPSDYDGNSVNGDDTMWAKMSKAGFFLLSLSLFPLLTLLVIASTTRLDLPTVVVFNLLPIPFIAIGGLLVEKGDAYPFAVASIFIPFATLLVTLTSGIFQVVGIITVASLLVNIFTYELGHKTSYREGYYVASLLTLAFSVHSKVAIVLLSAIIVVHIVTTKLGIQWEAITLNGLFAVTTCIELHLFSRESSCSLAWIVALLYSSLALIILKKHSQHNGNLDL